MSTSNTVNLRPLAIAQRDRLLELAKTVLLSESYSAKAHQTAIKVQKLLSSKSAPIYPALGRLEGVFQKARLNAASVSFDQVSQLGMELHQFTVKDMDLSAFGMTSAIEMPAQYDRLELRPMVIKMAALAQSLEKRMEPSLRSKAKNEWLAYSIISSCIPGAPDIMVHGCPFCHRHHFKIGGCFNHRIDGKLTVPIKQRQEFEKIHTQLIDTAGDFLESNLPDAKKIAEASNEKPNLAALKKTAQALLLPETWGQLENVIKECSSEERPLDALFERWHQINDDVYGVNDFDQDSSSKAAVLLMHTIRLDAYLRMGGDQNRRQRSAKPAVAPKRSAAPAQTMKKQVEQIKPQNSAAKTTASAKSKVKAVSTKGPKDSMKVAASPVKNKRVPKPKGVASVPV